MNKYELVCLIRKDFIETTSKILAYPEVYGNEIDQKLSIYYPLNHLLPRCEYMKNRIFDTFDFMDEWTEIIYNSINYWMAYNTEMTLPELINRLANDLVEDFVRE